MSRSARAPLLRLGSESLPVLRVQRGAQRPPGRRPALPSADTSVKLSRASLGVGLAGMPSGLCPLQSRSPAGGAPGDFAATQTHTPFSWFTASFSGTREHAGMWEPSSTHRGVPPACFFPDSHGQLPGGGMGEGRRRPGSRGRVPKAKGSLASGLSDSPSPTFPPHALSPSPPPPSTSEVCSSNLLDTILHCSQENKRGKGAG